MRKFLLFVLLFSCGLNQEKPVPPDNNSPAEVIVIDMSKHQSQVLAEKAKALELKNKGGSAVSDDVSPIVPEKKDDSTVLTKDDPNFENSEAIKKAVMDYSTNKTPEGFAKFLKVVKEKEDFPESVGFKVEGSEPMLLLQVVVSMAMNSEMKLTEEDSNAFFELFDSDLVIRDEETDAAALFPAMVKFLDAPEDKQFVSSKTLMEALLKKMESSASTAVVEDTVIQPDWMKDFVAAAYDFVSNEVDLDKDTVVDTVAAPLSSIELFYATLAKTSDSKMDDKFYKELVTKNKGDKKFEGFANAADLSCLLIPTYGSMKMSDVMKTLSDKEVQVSTSPYFTISRMPSMWDKLVEDSYFTYVVAAKDVFNCGKFLATLRPYEKTVITTKLVPDESWIWDGGLFDGVKTVTDTSIVTITPLDDEYLEEFITAVYPSLVSPDVTSSDKQ